MYRDRRAERDMGHGGAEKMVGTGRTPCASGITARRAGAVGAERAVELHHHAGLALPL